MTLSSNCANTSRETVDYRTNLGRCHPVNSQHLGPVVRPSHLLTPKSDQLVHAALERASSAENR